jgi:lysophospholipase L1-like esterase
MTIGLAPASAAPLDYAALGDSQASGLGTGSTGGKCQRGVDSYASLYSQHKKANLIFQACSGARTGDIAGQATKLNRGIDLVTVQIGGNDAGFSDVMFVCKTRSETQCAAAIDGAVNRIHGLGPSLDNAYRAIRAKASKARVVVVGYPRLFELGSCSGELSEYLRSRLNSAADVLANVTKGRADAAGFTYLDTRGAFAGRGVCAGNAWINGVRNPVAESYHPNKAGHRDGFYRALLNVTG